MMQVLLLLCLATSLVPITDAAAINPPITFPSAVGKEATATQTQKSINLTLAGAATAQNIAQQNHMEDSTMAVARSGRMMGYQDYGRFHKEMGEQGRDVLAHVGKGGKFTFSQMSKFGPIQRMFAEIGEGADMIESTKDFRKRHKQGKPLVSAAVRPRLAKMMDLQSVQDDSNAIATLTSKTYPTQQKSQQDTAQEKQQQKENPFSFDNVLNMLESNGFPEAHHNRYLRRQQQHNNNNNRHDKQHKKQQHRLRGHKQLSKEEEAAIIDAHLAEHNSGDGQPVAVFEFLELESTEQNIPSPQEILNPKPQQQQDSTTTTNQKPGSRPAAYDLRASDIGNSLNNAMKSKMGLGLFLPLLVASLTSNQASNPSAVDGLSNPDPFGTMFSKAPSTDQCYSMEEQWINQCAMPPTAYLELQVVTDGDKAGIQDSDRASVRRTMATQALESDKYTKYDSNTLTALLQIASMDDNNKEEEVEDYPSLFPVSNPSRLLLGPKPNQQQQQQQQRHLVTGGQGSRPGIQTTSMVQEVDLPENPKNEGAKNPNFIALLNNMFEPIEEAHQAQVEPNDEAVAAAFSTAGLKGMVGMNGNKGLGAMWPILGAANPTSNNQMVRSPDYYNPAPPGSSVPGEMQISGAEKCDRLLNSWTFKCAVMPM